ncbi:MAG: hypothetical protein GY749_22690 [Desulfobacteraceae bacterium]|nr:hypothetical protein [Desulfobacteraceae bacterium]
MRVKSGVKPTDEAIKTDMPQPIQENQKTDAEIIDIVEKHIFSQNFKLLTAEEYEKLHFVFVVIKVIMPICITVRYFWIAIMYLAKNAKELIVLSAASAVIWNMFSGNFGKILAYLFKGAE